MRKLCQNKIFQAFVQGCFVFSLGMVTSKLTTLQYILEHESTKISKDVVVALVSDIKLIKVASIIVWSFANGLYINFMYSINKEKLKNSSEE